MVVLVKKKRRRKKKRPLPPLDIPPDDEEDTEPVADVIKRHRSSRLRGISLEKLKEVEETPVPDTMTPSQIEEELKKLLDQEES